MSNSKIYLCSAGVNDEINALQQVALSNFASEDVQIVTTKSDTALSKPVFDVVTLEINGLTYPDPNLIARGFVEYLTSKSQATILFSANRYNDSIAARVGAALGANTITDVEQLISGADGLTVLKKAYSGALKQKVTLSAVQTTVLTINTRTMDEPTLHQKGTVTTVMVDPEAQLPAKATYKVLGNEGEANLATAERVVAGGRGLKDAENFKSLYQLAIQLNAAVGASRPAVDADWVGADAMIGQSGKTIAAKAYFAFGISGTIQHIIGIEQAKYIIAINNDAAAPIFKMADFGIIGDAKTVVQELIEKTAK